MAEQPRFTKEDLEIASKVLSDKEIADALNDPKRMNSLKQAILGMRSGMFAFAEAINRTSFSADLLTNVMKTMRVEGQEPPVQRIKSSLVDMNHFWIEGTKIAWDEDAGGPRLNPGRVWVLREVLHYVDEHGDVREVRGNTFLEEEL